MKKFILAIAAASALSGAAIAQEAPELAPMLNGQDAGATIGAGATAPDMMPTASINNDVTTPESKDIDSVDQVTRQTEDPNLSGSAN